MMIEYACKQVKDAFWCGAFGCIVYLGCWLLAGILAPYCDGQLVSSCALSCVFWSAYWLLMTFLRFFSSIIWLWFGLVGKRVTLSDRKSERLGVSKDCIRFWIPFCAPKYVEVDE